MPDNEETVTMSKAHSPAVFNGGSDNYYDPNFTLDINQKMTVPKSIRVNGDYSDDDASSINSNNWNNQPIPADKFDMNVPDRILVVGQDQHVGTKAPPIEMTLENSVVAPERGTVRCQTPPRILTLDDHYFPTVDDDDDEKYDHLADLNTTLSSSRTPASYINETPIAIARRELREQTPLYSALDVSLAPTDEIVHLRRQVGKLNRRVMACEHEIIQRQQREKIIYAITIAYFFFKAFNWMSRN